MGNKRYATNDLRATAEQVATRLRGDATRVRDWRGRHNPTDAMSRLLLSLATTLDEHAVALNAAVDLDGLAAASNPAIELQ